MKVSRIISDLTENHGNCIEIVILNRFPSTNILVLMLVLLPISVILSDHDHFLFNTDSPHLSTPYLSYPPLTHITVLKHGYSGEHGFAEGAETNGEPYARRREGRTGILLPAEGEYRVCVCGAVCV